MVCKHGFAETYAASVLVDDLAALGETHVDRVEMRLLEVPELYVAEMRERDREARGILKRFDRGVGGGVVVGIEGVGEFNESIGEDGRSTA